MRSLNMRLKNDGLTQIFQRFLIVRPRVCGCLINGYSISFYRSYLLTEYKNTFFSKIRVAFYNVYILATRSSVSIIYANFNICNFEEVLRNNIVISYD